MAQQPQQVQSQQTPVHDPENVPEILCVGPYNVFVTGPLATITFTNMRPDADPLLRQGAITAKFVVRARIVVPADSLGAIRDSIDQTIKNAQAATAGNIPPVTGGSVRH